MKQAKRILMAAMAAMLVLYLLAAVGRTPTRRKGRLMQALQP